MIMIMEVTGRKKRLNDFIASINKVDESKLLSVTEKIKAIGHLCTNEKRFLGEGMSDTEHKAKGKSGKVKYALTTYRSYLTDYRNLILAMNKRHYRADELISAIKKKFPAFDLSLLDADMPALRSNLSVLISRYSEIDSRLYEALRRLRLEHHAYYRMTASLSAANRAKTMESDSLYDKHTKNLKSVSRSVTYELLAKLHKSDHWCDLAVYVALASGRRSIEVLCCGEFEKVNSHTLRFSGQAKVKSHEPSNPYDILILDDAGTFLDAFQRLRLSLSQVKFREKNIQELDFDEVNGSTSARLNRVVKAAFNDETFTFKDLRSIYIKLLKEKYHDPSLITEEVFYSKMLGHSDKDISTQTSYKGIVLTEDVLPPDFLIKFSSDERVSPRFETKTKSANQLTKMNNLLKDQSKGMQALHKFVIELMKSDPSTIITQSLLSRSKNIGGAGAGRPMIKKYLELVGIHQ